jgi:uncharacterized membrane protein
LSTKSSSDKQPTIKAVGIKITNNKLSIGEVTTIQESVISFDPTKYSAPKKIEEGPTITIGTTQLLNITIIAPPQKHEAKQTKSVQNKSNLEVMCNVTTRHNLRLGAC